MKTEKAAQQVAAVRDGLACALIWRAGIQSCAAVAFGHFTAAKPLGDAGWHASGRP
jgi:hypothetical protein